MGAMQERKSNSGWKHGYGEGMLEAQMKKLEHLVIKNRRVPPDQIHTVDRHPIYFICENIRSLYNVGSIFRTSDALRIAKLYLCGYTGIPPRSEIDKVALGAVDSVPWRYRESAVITVTRLQEKGVRIFALEHTDKSRDFQLVKYSFPVGIVFGNEYEGITQETVSMCDQAVEIPMFGVKQSVNVSTACGIVGYELLRQLKVFS